MNFFGYDMEGNEIDESTVNELYRISENEILPNSDLYKICASSTISDDTFEYFATGTAFGANVNYIICATITTDSVGDKFDINKFIKDNDKLWKLNFDLADETCKNSYVIEFRVIVEHNRVTCVTVDDISIYKNISEYSSYDSKNYKDNFDDGKFDVFISMLAEPLVHEIHAKLSNL
jgi:hypothetical protein